ncbi:hypothetical protein [Cylindrospermum stagnale]|nr:hypothetical protein [Cylindrospermum stagnale]
MSAGGENFACCTQRSDRRKGGKIGEGTLFLVQSPVKRSPVMSDR